MVGLLDPDQAKRLISIARKSIFSFFEDKETYISEDIKEEFNEERGVFVTLYSRGRLRGCIGFPEPVLPLWKAVKEAAEGAGFQDPRFPALSREEYKDIRIEMSVLTKPEIINADKTSDYVSQIETGKDGLIIKNERGSGLLLPQVALEQGWDSERFLCETCKKAGLEKDCWKDMKSKVYKFQAQIFAERDEKIEGDMDKEIIEKS